MVECIWDCQSNWSKTMDFTWGCLIDESCIWETLSKSRQPTLLPGSQLLFELRGTFPQPPVLDLCFPPFFQVSKFQQAVRSQSVV